MRGPLRFAILAFVVAAATLCAQPARAQAYQPHTHDIVFLDANGMVVGEQVVYCNGTNYQWGVRTQNLKVLTHGGCPVINQKALVSSYQGSCTWTYWKIDWSDGTSTWLLEQVMCN